MNKIIKTYFFPYKDAVAKDEIRKWIGTHNGMSILKTMWCWTHTDGVNMMSVYILNISNPKTEMLFLLSFPNAVEESKVARNGYNEYIWPEP